MDKLFKELVARVQTAIVMTDTGQYLPLSKRQAMADTVTYEADDEEFRLVGGKYIFTYEQGRGPTVNMGPGEVRRYVREYLEENNITPRGQDRRGIPIDRDTLAFFISRKIHEYGSKPFRNQERTGVLSDIINQELIAEADEMLSEAYAADIAQFLLKAANE